MNHSDDEVDHEEVESEDPTDEDIRRFSAPVVATCPDCGAAVIEEAEICPKCHAYLWDGPPRRQSAARRGVRVAALVLIVIVAASLTGLLTVLLR